ncbi:unnamed protein product, partial [Meganyctiphanes norvegica]
MERVWVMFVEMWGVGVKVVCMFMPDEAETSQVEVVEGYNASLPCTIHSPPHDAPVLTLWFLATHDTPVYSYDQRVGREPSLWSEEEVFGRRARYLPMEHPPVLLLSNVTTKDARLYRCRVDYHHSSARVAWVRLNVLVPPKLIEIVGHRETVQLGDRDDVRCIATGGIPPAKVVWYQDGEIVDDSYSTDENGLTYNSLEFAAKRLDLTMPYECRASNNDVTKPLTRTYLRNVTTPPLSVVITSDEKPLVAGESAKLSCTVLGSNPPAVVSWYLQNEAITPLHTTVHPTDNMTVSVLYMTINKQHNDAQLICRAVNPMLGTDPLEDLYKLNVAYRPNVSLTLGHSLNGDLLKEGNDVFFECKVDSNPPPYKVKWMHQAQEQLNPVPTQPVSTKDYVKLMKICRKVSVNLINISCEVRAKTPNTLKKKIRIQNYAPRCAVAPALRGVAMFELTNISCAVDADPANVTFSWTFNNSVRRDQSEKVGRKKKTIEDIT